MPLIKVKNDGYEIEELGINEKVECPDKSTEVERIDDDHFKLIIKKGKIIES